MRHAVGFALAGLLAGLTVSGRGAPLSRGYQWVRSHPFTVTAMSEFPVNQDVYAAVGFTSYFALFGEHYDWADRALSQAGSVGMPWHYLRGDGSLEWCRKHVPEFRAKYPGNTGWCLGDESDPAQFATLGAALEQVRELAPGALVYSVARGMDWPYAPDAYRSYLDQYLRGVRPDVLAYDQYPFYGGGTADSFLDNLGLVRQKAQAAGIPYWTWLQSHGWAKGPFNEPSESQMRLQAFAALAYGCTGLLYWTYASSYQPYSAAMLDANGQPTGMYRAAAGLVPEVTHLGQALRMLHSTSIGFVPGRRWEGGKWLSTSPPGVARWAPEPGSHLRKVYVRGGGHGCLVGGFRGDAGEEYFMLVNWTHGLGQDAAATAADLSVRFDAGVSVLERLDRGTGRMEAVPLRDHKLEGLRLPGGTGDLFRIATDPP